MTFNTRTTHTQKQSYRLYSDGVLLTNVQCHMVLISIPWHGEYWTIQLKTHLKPDSIKSSNTPAWPHQRLVCMSLRKSFNCKNAAVMCGMYIIKEVHGPEPRSSEGNTSSNPQVSALIPRSLFLLSMGWRGCASAIGVIETPILLF